MAAEVAVVVAPALALDRVAVGMVHGIAGIWGQLALFLLHFRIATAIVTARMRPNWCFVFVNLWISAAIVAAARYGSNWPGRTPQPLDSHHRRHRQGMVQLRPQPPGMRHQRRRWPAAGPMAASSAIG